MAAALNDDGFKIGSTSASDTLKMVERLSLWLEQPQNQQVASDLAQKLITSLSECLIAEGSQSEKLRRERMWGHYHKCRTSDTFKQNWETFLETATSRPSCPIMYQYLTDVQFNWSMVAADWEEEEAQALLELVVDLWITIRGFSFTSTWIKASVQGRTQKICSEV